MLFEPAEHDAVEGVGRLDIREMLHAGDLFVARARHQPGEAPVLAGRGAGIVRAAYDQERHPHRGEVRHEIEIEDRRAATEIAGRSGADDGVADLCPAARVLRLEGIGQPAFDRAVGASEFASRTVFMRSAQISAAPFGLAGRVSHHSAEISRSPWASAKAWPCMPPIDSPV